MALLASEEIKQNENIRWTEFPHRFAGGNVDKPIFLYKSVQDIQ